MKKIWTSLCILLISTSLLAFDFDYEDAEQPLKERARVLLKKWQEKKKENNIYVKYFENTLRCNGSYNDFGRNITRFIGVCTIHMVQGEVDVLGVIHILPGDLSIQTFPIYMD